MGFLRSRQVLRTHERSEQHFFERQSKKFQRQGARIPRTEAYFWYAAGRREEGERSIWAFYEAVKDGGKEFFDGGSGERRRTGTGGRLSPTKSLTSGGLSEKMNVYEKMGVRFGPGGRKHSVRESLNSRPQSSVPEASSIRPERGQNRMGRSRCPDPLSTGRPEPGGRVRPIWSKSSYLSSTMTGAAAKC